MADLDLNQASQTVRLVGNDEANFIDIDSSNQAKTINETIVTNDALEASKSSLVAGSDGTNQRPLLTDNEGRLVTSALTGFGADFSFGDIATAATTKVVVRRTAYTEQTTNAQRSIASANANDTLAGTGARKVVIKYLDQSGNGPFEEEVSLNGTTYVNTVATNICYIEEITVTEAGSLLSNQGIITLKATTAGGGATIGTIGALANRTFWAHHYVPINKICNITGISCSHNGTTVGSGAVFVLESKKINGTSFAQIQVSDFVRLYGQSSTFSRSYQSPIKVTGPARLEIYVTPESASAFTYRSAFDFFEP
jgi:hypothetical protein